MSTRAAVYWGVALIVIILGGLYYIYGSSHMAPAAPAPVPIAHPFGQITSVSGSKLTLKSISGTLIVNVAPNATVTGAKGGAASLAVGQIVTISSSTPNTDGSLNATLIAVIPPPPPPPPPSK